MSVPGATEKGGAFSPVPISPRRGRGRGVIIAAAAVVALVGGWFLFSGGSSSGSVSGKQAIESRNLAKAAMKQAERRGGDDVLNALEQFDKRFRVGDTFFKKQQFAEAVRHYREVIARCKALAEKSAPAKAEPVVETVEAVRPIPKAVAAERAKPAVGVALAVLKPGKATAVAEAVPVAKPTKRVAPKPAVVAKARPPRNPPKPKAWKPSVILDAAPLPEPPPSPVKPPPATAVIVGGAARTVAAGKSVEPAKAAVLAPAHTAAKAPVAAPPAAGPKTFRVAADGSGHFKTIKEALAKAKAGDTILVLPGLYKESILLNKEVDLVGTGTGVTVESRQDDCLTMAAKTARVRMLSLRARGGRARKRLYGVRVPTGRLTLENCDITSDSLACVFVSGTTANPILRRCRILKGADSGVVFSDGARGTVEDCDIRENGKSGVVVIRDANPDVRRCGIRHNRQSGVYIADNGLGLFEDCDIQGNRFAGVSIREGGAPMVRKTRIRQGQMSGVYVRNKGRGVIEFCDIVGNDGAGVEVKSGGSVVVRRCKITNNAYEAIWLHAKGSATVTNSDLRENGRGPFDVAKGCVLKRLANRW